MSKPREKAGEDVGPGKTWPDRWMTGVREDRVEDRQSNGASERVRGTQSGHRV
jgi:hypothetical protein